MFKGFKFKRKQVGLAVLALFCLYLAYEIFSVQSPGTQGKTFSVAKGDNFLTISNNLKMAGLIKSRLAFDGLVFLRGSFLNLKAGQYAFEPGLNLSQVIDKIERGEAMLGDNEVVLGISEGQDLEDINSRINFVGQGHIDLTKIKADYFLGRYPWLSVNNIKYNTLEGFMFPDTYRLEKGSDINVVIRKVLKNFETKTASLRNQTHLLNKDFYQVLIVASILEKEVPLKDMPLAAGVIWRRLAIGMPLQVDASLVYALNRPITLADTKSLNSPYNTYKNKGLPPTPISNPGLAALNAALHPQSSDYLFYLTNPADRSTIFSKTGQEHNLARAKYLK